MPAPPRPGGEVAGVACVQAVPFHSQVSPKTVVPDRPPKRTVVPLSGLNAIAAYALGAGVCLLSGNNGCAQLPPPAVTGVLTAGPVSVGPADATNGNNK